MTTSTIVATLGSASSNSYITLAEADQFVDDRPAASSTWASATDAEKTQAILWATKLMDRLIDWEGQVVDGVQSLDWPRNGLIYPSGYAVESDIIPVEIKDATAEFARQLLDEDRSGDSAVETQGLTSLRVGPIALTFKDSVFAKVVPDAVVNLIPEEWLLQVRGRAIGVINLVRV
jgi:hypothetical protein